MTSVSVCPAGKLKQEVHHDGRAIGQLGVALYLFQSAVSGLAPLEGGGQVFAELTLLILFTKS